MSDQEVPVLVQKVDALTKALEHVAPGAWEQLVHSHKVSGYTYAGVAFFVMLVCTGIAIYGGRKYDQTQKDGFMAPLLLGAAVAIICAFVGAAWLLHAAEAPQHALEDVAALIH